MKDGDVLKRERKIDTNVRKRESEEHKKYKKSPRAKVPYIYEV